MSKLSQTELCKLHDADLTKIKESIRNIELAVCGNETLGVNGLVNDVRDLKSWRRNLDLRIAGLSSTVAGVCTIAITLVKNFVGK